MEQRYERPQQFITLPEFDSSPLKSYLPNRKVVVFQSHRFAGTMLNFGMVSENMTGCPQIHYLDIISVPKFMALRCRGHHQKQSRGQPPNGLFSSLTQSSLPRDSCRSRDPAWYIANDRVWTSWKPRLNRNLHRWSKVCVRYVSIMGTQVSLIFRGYNPYPGSPRPNKEWSLGWSM